MKTKEPDVLPATGIPYILNPDKLLQSIVDAIFIIDESGIFRYVSPACKNLFGYRPEEMTGFSFTRFIHPDDIPITIEIASRKTPGSKTSNFENRYFRKDGSIISLTWSGHWDLEDKMLYCVARDASEKNNIRHRLLEAQKMARVANYEFDLAKQRYTYTSDTLFEILGLDRKKYPVFTTEIFDQLIHPDDKERVWANINNPKETAISTIEYRIIKPDGNVVYLNRLREVVRDPKGNPVKFIGTLQDITDRKISEMAVKQSENRLRSLVQNGNDIIGIISPDGIYSFVAENIKEHLGYEARELLGKNAFDFIHPDDVENIVQLLSQVNTKNSITAGPFRFRNHSGEWIWIETNVSNHIDNPAIGGFVVNSRNITEKKIKDDALQKSEKRFKALVENGSDLIVIIDANANFSYVSDNVRDLLGYEPNEMGCMNAFEFIHPNDAEKVSNEIKRVLERKEKAKGVQHRFRHKNGTYLWLESKGNNHLDDPSIRGILVNARNIDDRVKLQKRLDHELINKQKEITSAVIRAQESERSQIGLELHDNVNQILTTVKLYNEMYLTGYVEDKNLLVKASQFTQECIDEIRSISKRLSAPTLGKILLHDSIKELVDSINLTKKLEIVYLPEGIDNLCVAEELHLAIYRIVQEALNNVIKHSQASSAIITINASPNQIILGIRDNGIGFDMETKSNGIGITNMRSRAESLHADFQLFSSIGQGCTIEISFPHNK